MTPAGYNKFTLADMPKRAPNSLQHARTALSNSLKSILKQLEAVEKSFYDNKPVAAEVGRRARMLSKDPRSQATRMCKHYHSLDTRVKLKPVHMERLVTRAFISDEVDLSPMIEKVRKLYDKTWKFLPGQLQPVVDKLEAVLKYQRMYCPPVYDPNTDPYIQVAQDYHTKYKAWTADIKKYMNHVTTLHERFQKGTLYLDEMSQNTRELAMKLEAEDCPFVFAFYDSCEVLKETIKCLQDWLTVGNEYTNFLVGEMESLQESKISLQKKALKQQDRYNKENYKLMTLKHDLDTQELEQASLQSKEMEMLVREELLRARISEMKLDFDIKEFRLAEMRRTVNPKTAAQSVLDAMSQLAEEVRVEGAELNDINKELSLIGLKMAQVLEKQDTYKHLSETYIEMNEAVKKLHRDYLASSKELDRVNVTVDHIKYMVQYLSTPDTAQMIFLDLPRRREALGISRSHGLNISGSGDDMMDKVITILSSYLGNRWIDIYRQLPFYPSRGQRTIEEDIRQIQIDCVRDSLDKEVRKSLERWRRFHTRARPAELLAVIQSLGDEDILKAIDRIVNPPRPKTPLPETFPTFLEEKLIPYYQQVSRYDSYRHKKEHPTATPMVK